MAIITNSILLLKSDSSLGDDHYGELLRSNNFHVRQVKTIEFQYRNLDVLKKKLLKPDDYSGFIFSSPRCVEALFQLQMPEAICQAWGTKRNFAIGETTHATAEQTLGIICDGKDCGNAQALGNYILTTNENYSKPFLVPHGNLSNHAIEATLKKGNISVENILVYDTLSNSNIEKDIYSVTSGHREIPEYLIFFSPSGFRNTIECLRKIPSFLDSAKLIAIGPTTESAILASKCKVFGVAEHPTPEGILKILL